MRVGPGVSVPVFAVPGKQNPTWVRIRPNNEGYPPHLTQLSGSKKNCDEAPKGKKALVIYLRGANIDMLLLSL